jgi:multidrug efflux pump
MNHGYREALIWALNWRWLIITVFFMTGAGAAWLFLHLKSELSPLEDRGVIIGVSSRRKELRLQYTDGYARQLEQFYQAIP